MEKVLLSKVKATALESALETCGRNKASLIQQHATGQIWTGERKYLNDFDLDTVCSALYIGYEIEQGPEEKVLEYYHRNPDVAPVIEDILNFLNITIPGIN